MKRSELKQKIRDILEGQFREEDWVEQILTAVEEAGMQPPAFKYDPGCGIRHIEYQHCWEPEEE